MPSAPNVSERLFEAFCRDAQIECVRIPQSTAKTPDYLITVDGNEIVCEVKQIEPNDADRQDGAAWENYDEEGQ